MCIGCYPLIAYKDKRLHQCFFCCRTICTTAYMKFGQKNLVNRWTPFVTKHVILNRLKLDRTYICLKEDCSGQRDQALSLGKPVHNAENTTRNTTFPCSFSSQPLYPYQTTITLLKLMPPKEHCEDINTRILWRPASRDQLVASWKAEGKPWHLSPKSSWVSGRTMWWITFYNHLLYILWLWYSSSVYLS